ncbi:MAG: hypothetical protein K0Q82_560 [Chryseobacterium indoltheticum]|jgi:pyruvate/2-oxoglutarate dehydrogenase complex dihydrolipoamide dehydrogenase (E3) component|nr:hypothetical protein [Chryseobacterium indoltheticum]
MKQYDYIIIGSGQAGTPLAFSLAKSGRVAIMRKRNWAARASTTAVFLQKRI